MRWLLFPCYITCRAEPRLNSPEHTLPSRTSSSFLISFYSIPHCTSTIMLRRAMASLSSPAFLFLLSLCSAATAADSTVDPADDPKNPLHYTPTNSLTLMAISEYHPELNHSATLTWPLSNPWGHRTHPNFLREEVWRQIHARHGHRDIQYASPLYSWPTPLSAFTAYAIGFALRWPLRSNPDSITWYATYNFFVTLSPCGFIAAEYVLLGRLSRWLGADRHVLIPPTKITKVFVLSDVVTFLTQVRYSKNHRLRIHS